MFFFYQRRFVLSREEVPCQGLPFCGTEKSASFVRSASFVGSDSLCEARR